MAAEAPEGKNGTSAVPTSGQKSQSTSDPANTNASPSMIKGASLLITFQLFSRLLTFAANQLLLRLLTAPLLGLSAQLDVYCLSVLFFARESLRVAIQRQGPSASTGHQSSESQAVVNLGYLAVALGSVASVALGWMYMASANEAMLETPYFIHSLYLYGVASVVELLAEPGFVLMQTRLQFGTRAAAESSATFARCAVVYGSALWASRNQRDLGVLPFALGQFCYGSVLLLVYMYSSFKLASSQGFSIFPQSVVGPKDDKVSNFVGRYFYRPTISLAGSMMAQSFVKHLLTQGDTFLVSLLSTPAVQGTYALANNYGGLFARLLFQPVEESSRSYFSRLLSAEKPATKPSPAVTEAKQSLSTILRFYILLSVVVATLGPFAAHPLLAIAAGRRWIGSGAGDVLAAYCFYIPFLALNGIAESFVASVATQGQVHRQSVWMGAFSVAFGASAFVSMRVLPFGATGLVMANSINMLCRIIWSASFISTYFKDHGTDIRFGSLIPKSACVLSFGTSIMMYQLNIVDNAEQEPILALAKVASFALPLLVSFAFTERQFLLACYDSIRSRKSGK